MSITKLKALDEGKTLVKIELEISVHGKTVNDPDMKVPLLIATEVPNHVVDPRYSLEKIEKDILNLIGISARERETDIALKMQLNGGFRHW
ncbi:MAG: hypothetical protein ABF443_00085 [Acetobacter malorum]|uniref:hypothetical protein n=1 Tax=Acetobacter malorum TaxID=178901 RepID=UPI0039ED5561